MREGIAETARGVRDVADTVASGLDDSRDGHRAPSALRLAVGAALAGAAYVGAKRLGVTSAVAKYLDDVIAKSLDDVRSGLTESRTGGANGDVASGSPPQAGAPGAPAVAATG